MDIVEARMMLDGCDRQELRDHAFGDMEIAWTRAGYEIAYGYTGDGKYGVSIVDGASFEGDQAMLLLDAGVLSQVERNDMTGPDDFVPGRVMPGLTHESVKRELMKDHFFRERKTNGFRR